MMNDKTEYAWGYLTLVQLLAAFLVMYSHSYPLATGNGGASVIVNGGMTWGDAAVDVFLLISGFMVCTSFAEKQGVDQRIFECLRFCVKRVVRIVPVVWVAILLALFVVGPLFTTQSLSSYFSDGLFYEYAKSLNPFDIKYFFLPGVFEHNFNHGVNGSLWVIPWQMWCYVAVAILGLLGVHRNRLIVTVICSIVGACFIGQDRFVGATRFAGLPLSEGIRLFAFFFAGWTWRLWMSNVVPNGLLSLLLLLTLPMWLCTSAQYVALAVIGGYCLITLLNLPSSCILERLPRISFGVFVFGFMVQQCIVFAYGGKMDNWLNFVLSALVTVPLAGMELYLIERPASMIRQWLLRRIDNIEQGLSCI